MKPLLFKVPAIEDRTFRVEQDNFPHFYGLLHFHPEIQLTLIQEGEGTLIVGDKIDRFGRNDVLLLGSNLPHVLRSDPDYFAPESTRRSVAISVLFRAEHLEPTVLNLPETRHLQLFLRESQHGVRLRCGEGHPLTEKFESLPTQRPIEQFLTLLSILDYLSTCADREVISATAFTHPQRPEDHQRLERVFSFILENYHASITLEDVASMANLTPGAFCRFFRQHTRKTFLTLLNEVRIEHACRYLRESKQTISQIAFSCGYTNLSNFNRQFKGITGMAPGEYIRSYNRTPIG
ncbi:MULTISPECIES: AraC family transcriptional regulator [unclassified Spirosoma]|uniref:helix-turn-helix domain-containing protein n=1 Tax=unclassified Spirosoma TaxID=2621999 RepID=UPI0009626E8D|nr:MULTISPECIES: AraC family transcriptional regulator [unclassified Spirosoma]MBN8826490.1 helix-turn-helix domain-containing protein [Spirosoma sp.]OJW76419.1 MAG: AraC family transcriptional regulator [Spirosoma sp. 48-14]